MFDLRQRRADPAAVEIAHGAIIGGLGPGRGGIGLSDGDKLARFMFQRIPPAGAGRRLDQCVADIGKARAQIGKRHRFARRVDDGGDGAWLGLTEA